MSGIEENFFAMDGVEKKLTSFKIAEFAKVDNDPAYRGLDTLFAEALSGAAKISAQESKAGLLTKLSAAFGYGGMIHSFKDYVISPDDKYRASTSKHIVALKDVLAKYLRHEISRGERAAISDIVTVVDVYAKSLERTTMLLANGNTSEAIYRAVKVDNSKAFRSMNLLGRGISKNIEGKTIKPDQISRHRIKSGQ